MKPTNEMKAANEEDTIFGSYKWLSTQAGYNKLSKLIDSDDEIKDALNHLFTLRSNDRKYDIHSCINEAINAMQLHFWSHDNQNNHKLRFEIKTVIDKMLTQTLQK